MVRRRGPSIVAVEALNFWRITDSVVVRARGLPRDRSMNVASLQHHCLLHQHTSLSLCHGASRDENHCRPARFMNAALALRERALQPLASMYNQPFSALCLPAISQRDGRTLTSIPPSPDILRPRTPSYYILDTYHIIYLLSLESCPLD